MSRLNVIIPEIFQFSTQIPVLIEHINYGSHLGNDSYLAILHEARIRFLECLSISETSLCDDIGLVLTDSYISYKNETTRGDLLDVFVKIDHLTRLECDFFYKIVSAKTKKVIAVAKTGAAFFDYKKRKLSPLMKERFSFFEQSISKLHAAL